jgi:hypothetical protein
MIVGLIDESDLHKWTITMDGPPGSPYAVCKNISQTVVTSKLSVTFHPRQRSARTFSPNYLARDFVSEILRARRNAQHLMILPKSF